MCKQKEETLQIFDKIHSIYAFHVLNDDIQLKRIAYESSVESQKGVNAVQQYSIENQKDTILLYEVCGNSALLVLNGT